MSSSLKKITPSSNLGDSKQNSTLAMMREKAAAEKNIGRVPPPPQQTKNLIRNTSSASTMPSSTVSQLPTSSYQYASKPHSTALASIIDLTNKPTASPRKVTEKPLSPIQTYVMSDREESDSESESDDEDERQRPKKSVSDISHSSTLK